MSKKKDVKERITSFVSSHEELMEELNQKELRIYESKSEFTGCETIEDPYGGSVVNFSNYLKLTRVDILYKHYANKEGMWALATWKWLRPFAEWINGRKVLEVMSGRGWISKGLRELGVNVIATDNFSSHMSWNVDERVTDVEDLDAISAVDKYGDSVDILLMAWPPYGDPIAYEVSKRLYEVNPNALIVYIGEGCGGCTAEDDFFENTVDVYDKVFDDTVSYNYERWNALHDYPMLLKYNDNSK